MGSVTVPFREITEISKAERTGAALTRAFLTASSIKVAGVAVWARDKLISGKGHRGNRFDAHSALLATRGPGVGTFAFLHRHLHWPEKRP
jgi:hypothetical protein